MKSFIDHLVVTAPDLMSGKTYIESVLGVALEKGGTHPKMGTHNLLLSLGPSTYLEVLAVDPEAEAATRPRWFGLDLMTSGQEPRLSAWVVRVEENTSLDSNLISLLGKTEEMSRGAYSWTITIPSNGLPPLDGALPALIRWSENRHPAAFLRTTDLLLDRLEICHPEAECIRNVLGELGLNSKVQVVSELSGKQKVLTAFLSQGENTRVL